MSCCSFGFISLLSFRSIDICRLACATRKNRFKGYCDRFPPRFYICRTAQDRRCCNLPFVLSLCYGSPHHFQLQTSFSICLSLSFAYTSLDCSGISRIGSSRKLFVRIYSFFSFFETRNGRWADKQFNSLKCCDCAAEWEWVVYVIDELAFFLSSRAMMRRSKLDVRRDEMHSLRFHQYCSFVWWKMIFSRGKSVDKQPILLNYWTANSIVLFANRIVFCVFLKSPPFQVEKGGKLAEVDFFRWLLFSSIVNINKSMLVGFSLFPPRQCQ